MSDVKSAPEVVSVPEDAGYIGQEATPHNIEVAKLQCYKVVREHKDGIDAALKAGMMTAEEAMNEYDAGVYNYVYLENEDGSWTVVSLVAGGEPVVKKMSRAALSTYHPFHNPNNDRPGSIQ